MPSAVVAFSDWPSLLLILFWLGLMVSLRRTGYVVALLSLGATVLHEACHLLAGLVFNAKPVSFSLLPKRHGRYWVFGTVGFSNLTIWNAAFVAFAPLAMLPLGWLIFQVWMRTALLAEAYLSWCVAGYVVACCAFACLPSVTDLKLGALSGLMYCAIGAGIWLAAA
jgi:hypothetical protein